MENCELWVEGNKIAYIGKPKESPISFDRKIDCNGNLVMPSFKNGHGHGIMTFCRSIADDLPLDKWLNEKIFPMENNLELKKLLLVLQTGNYGIFKFWYFNFL